MDDEEGFVGGSESSVNDKDTGVKKKSKKIRRKSTSKKKTPKLPVENEKLPRSARRLSTSPGRKKKTSDEDERLPPTAGKLTPSPGRKKRVVNKKPPVASPTKNKHPPKKHPPKKHPPKKHPPRNGIPKSIPKITDDDAWEDDESSDIYTDSDDEMIRNKTPNFRRKNSTKPEGCDDVRWEELQEQFLEYSNFRLLPGKSVEKDKVVQSFRDFRSGKQKSFRKEGLPGQTASKEEMDSLFEDFYGAAASTEEIEAIFEDFYERKIREGISGGVYYGVHLNPKFVKGGAVEKSKQKPGGTNEYESDDSGEPSKETMKVRSKAAEEEDPKNPPKRRSSTTKSRSKSRSKSRGKSRDKSRLSKTLSLTYSSRSMGSKSKKSDKTKDGDKPKKKKTIRLR
jgi:hypothetical protein